VLDDALDQPRLVISRAQALAAGVSKEAVRAHLRAGRWQRIVPGVYATFSGPVARTALLAAMVLHAGDGAVLSHETAAELAALTDERSALIHISVPTARRPRPFEGVVYHRSGRGAQAVQPNLWPPRTRVEETIVDLVDAATTLNQALGWITRGCGRRLTTPSRLRDAIALRKKLRWSKTLTEVLADVEDGCHSVLEWRYKHDVERAHGLPVGRRQAVAFRGRRKHYDDVRYDKYRLVAELDGLAAHPLETRSRDRQRDNATTERGDQVVRYGWADVALEPCATAAQLARLFQAAGWRKAPRSCGRKNCVINQLYRRPTKSP
jgi:very-short-patch-repair endonuclease